MMLEASTLQRRTLIVLLLLGSATWVAGQAIVAHRGASHDAPENTLSAFRLAWEQGADAIEGDFHLTSDGRIVCHHDATTARICGVDLAIAKTPLSRLRTLDVGAWKGERWAGESMPTLEEVLSVLPEDRRLFLEVKCGPEIVRPLAQLLGAAKAGPPQVVIISFQEAVVREVRRWLPDYKVNWLSGYQETPAGWRPLPDRLLAILEETRATGFGTQANLAVVDRGLVARLQRAGLEFHAWTVNEVPAARTLRELGVESITTDRPGWLRAGLAAPTPLLRGESPPGKGG